LLRNDSQDWFFTGFLQFAGYQQFIQYEISLGIKWQQLVTHVRSARYGRASTMTLFLPCGNWK
jgi:hypothetical protein